MRPFPGSITDIQGIKVGHAQNPQALTGCSVILFEKGAVGGVDQRGGAPGTRETDLLQPMHIVQKIHAIMLAGGSAFGLDAASGVMRYLEERKIGFDVGVAHVPVVPSAILFDLELGSAAIRPDANMGYSACLAASKTENSQGNIGAGMGAAIGKMFGIKHAMKGGIGTASIDVGGGIIVAAMVAVNAFGDVIDPTTGKIIAGLRNNDGAPADTLETMRSTLGRGILHLAASHNTIIGVVATNAKLTKEQVNKVAQTSHNGLARSVRPAHGMFDGDTLFAVATGQRVGNINVIAAYAPEVVAQAIFNAVYFAEPAGGLPSARSLGLIEEGHL